MSEQAPPQRNSKILDQFRHGSIWEQLGAISSIGSLIIAIVALWSTFQISGLEGYFQSILKLRNQQLESASKRLDKTQEKIDLADIEIVKRNEIIRTKTKSLELLEGNLISNAEKLQSLRERTMLMDIEIEEKTVAINRLLKEKQEIVNDVNFANAEIALRDFKNRLISVLLSSALFSEIDIRKPILFDPVDETISILMSQYIENPSKRKTTQMLFGKLEAECSSGESDIVKIAAIEVPYTAYGEEFDALARYQKGEIEQSEYIKIRDAVRARVSKYSCATSRIESAISDARKNARNKIYKCAARILNTPPVQFDKIYASTNPLENNIFDSASDEQRDARSLRRKFTRSEDNSEC